MKKFSFQQQVLRTVDYIIANDITILNLKQTSYKEESCWGQISILLLNKFDKIVSLQLWRNWKNNVGHYQDAVQRHLELRGYNRFKNTKDISLLEKAKQPLDDQTNCKKYFII